MITKVIEIDGSEHAIRPNGDVRKVATYYGKDADLASNGDGTYTISSPYVRDAVDADRFYTKDTMRVFMFDEDISQWWEQKSN